MRLTCRALAVLPALAAAWLSALPHAAVAQRNAGTGGSAEATTREQGKRFADLQPAHRVALKPLERAWPGLGADTKQKWIDIATRLPRMSPEERARIETRMSEWVAMTPAQRTQARLQFKEAEQVAPKGRQAQWEAYKALPDEQKRQLADREAAAQTSAGAAAAGARGRQARTAADEAQQRQGQQKSNIVPVPGLPARPRAVAPAVVQAAPGATTTLLSKRPTPPAHQQVGLPKIVGSPNFVDPVTLLPRRGPQGAAVTAATASAPLPRP